MKAPLGRTAYIVVFLLAATYVVATLSGARGIPAVLARQKQIQRLEDRNAQLAREIERKRDHILRLQNDASEQELEIRDRYKLVHPGDTVFITGQPDKK
ncbi:MAG: septum formation initiator family protein [Bryobacteraceae bacterium]|jgi:cell division protein FtsB